MYSNFNETANYSVSSQEIMEPCKSCMTHATSLNGSPDCQIAINKGSLVSQDSEIVEFLIHEDYKVWPENETVIEKDSVECKACCFKEYEGQCCLF